jgi:hypothetical protein
LGLGGWGIDGGQALPFAARLLRKQTGLCLGSGSLQGRFRAICRDARTGTTANARRATANDALGLAVV